MEYIAIPKETISFTRLLKILTLSMACFALIRKLALWASDMLLSPLRGRSASLKRVPNNFSMLVPEKVSLYSIFLFVAGRWQNGIRNTL